MNSNDILNRKQCLKKHIVLFICANCAVIPLMNIINMKHKLSKDSNISYNNCT